MSTNAIVIYVPGEGFVARAHDDVVSIASNAAGAITFTDCAQAINFLEEQAPRVIAWAGYSLLNRTDAIAIGRRRRQP